MRRTLKQGIAVIAAASLMAVVPATAQADSDRSRGANLKVTGLANDGTKLVRFTTNNPRKARGGVAVSGLTGGDTRLIGIDYRVQDGRLYGVGNNAASAGIYSIDPRTGVAALFTRLTVALSGTSFGVDFNPAANALRIVSDSGQNLRQPLAVVPTATANDATLAYPPAAPPATGITGAAYTNNDLDPNTGTTLFDLDTTLDQIAIQSPANAGTLAATGKLGLDAAGETGFDIFSKVRKGRTVAVRGFAAINGSLYEINLLTGQASRHGRLGTSVTDIAIPLKKR